MSLKIETKGSNDWIARIVPDKDGSVIRTSSKFKSGRFKGETKEFITVEVTIIRKERVVNGRTKRQGGIQSRRVFYSVWEHVDKLDFDDIVNNDLETMPEFEKKGDNYFVVGDYKKGEYPQVEIDWMPSGAHYVFNLPAGITYEQNGGKWSSVSFFLTDSRNTLANVEYSTKAALSAVGIDLDAMFDDFDADARKAEQEANNK
jgi:hypothetical protein